MNKPSQIKARSQDAAHDIPQAGTDPAVALPVADHVGETVIEIHANNDEKLAAIRHAIQRGDYDSDAILEKALHRLLKGLEESKDEQ